MADGRIHATSEELTAALHGRVTSHHRFLVKLHLDQIDAIAQAIASIDKEVDSQVEPFRQAAQMLSAIPGLGPLAALVVLAEIGLDMSHFSSAAHLISWAGLCPRNDESAGKRRSTRMRNGAPWLKTVLIQCAWAAARTKESYFHSLYHRLRSRRGAKKAIGAVAASLLTTVYHMLKNGTLYEDLGANYFDQKSKERQARRLINRLNTLGYLVHVEQMTA
jgi:transposase